jgi:anti-anti-sigma factor
MEVSISLENIRVPVTVMRVAGDVDSANAGRLQEEADKLVASGARYILMDFEKTAFISSAGLRVIHKTFNALRALHKDADDDSLRKSMSAGAYKAPYLKVVNLSATAREAFQLAGFDTYIDTYIDLQSALKSF